MNISVDEESNILLEDGFNSIILKKNDGEEMTIRMRDDRFEFKYQDKWYFAKKDRVEPFHEDDQDNAIPNGSVTMFIEPLQ
jgi:hypothetical protein